jgi:hypothetical protein
VKTSRGDSIDYEDDDQSSPTGVKLGMRVTLLAPDGDRHQSPYDEKITVRFSLSARRSFCKHTPGEPA